MKNKLIALALLFLGFNAAHAQTTKGTQNLGLGIGFYSSLNNSYYNDPLYPTSASYQSNSGTNFGIGPSYSYFVANGFDIGANLNYTYSHNSNTFTYPSSPSTTVTLNPVLQTTNSFAASIYAHKYIMYQNKIGIRTGPFASYGFGKQKNTNSNPIENYDSTIKNYSVGGSLDVVYYPSTRIGVTATLANISYNNNKTDSGNHGYQNQEGFLANFITNGLGLSLFYVIAGR